MPESWELIGDECPHCGCEAEALTCSTEPNTAFDGDKVRCCECGMPGTAQVEEDGDLWVSWHDEPDCDCDWCQLHDGMNCTAAGCPAATTPL